MKKSYVVLCLYDALSEGKTLKIQETCAEFGISVSTFRRYIAFLRLYFAERHGYEIVYDSRSAAYALR